VDVIDPSGQTPFQAGDDRIKIVIGAEGALSYGANSGRPWIHIVKMREVCWIFEMSEQ
jgi:hypothetical protein